MQAEQQSERERFEADAGPYGFDLTRCELSLSGEPWTEYRDSGTGHRWAGWLAARNPHQVPAALSHPSTPQWQPIESAPDDGTEVLAWREDCGQFIASYTSPDSFPMTQEELDVCDEDWLFRSDWFTQWPQAIRLDGSETPTHWMPLPPPPEQGGKG